MKARFSKWLDECRLAAIGIVLASRNAQFWLVFALVFVIFGTLISLLSAGTSAIDLFFATDFGGKMQILGDGFLTLFGKGRSFWDFLVNFAISLLQAVLIALIVLVFKKRKQLAKDLAQNGQNSSDSASLQNAGIAAGLALLGSGCPTCGTTLITPILTSLFSTGSYAIAGTISGIMTFLAYALILWSLKKMGLEAYVIIKDEEWRKRRGKNSTTRPSAEENTKNEAKKRLNKRRKENGKSN